MMGRLWFVMGTGLALVAVSFLGLLVMIGSVGQPSALPGVACAPQGGPAARFTDQQLANAAAIVAAGAALGVPARANVIAVATAMQESTLLRYANATVPASLELPHERVGSDHDSVGLFQQRAPWGPLAVRMDPGGSARLFFERLLAVPGWQAMPLTLAAQTVQVSAFPDAYASWEAAANQVVGAVTGVTCPASADSADNADLPTNPGAATVMARALSQRGVPYVWGGGGPAGPTAGGFDCSGLMVYAFAGIGVTVPHQTQLIWADFQPRIRDLASIQPGDMLLFGAVGGDPATIEHVGLYLGGSRMVHAPTTGQTVTVAEDLWGSGYWRPRFVGAVGGLPATSTRSL